MPNGANRNQHKRKKRERKIGSVMDHVAVVAVKIDEQTTSYRCNQCRFASLDLDVIDNHSQSHIFKCIRCDHISANLQSLNNHKLKHHSLNPPDSQLITFAELKLLKDSSQLQEGDNSESLYDTESYLQTTSTDLEQTNDHPSVNFVSRAVRKIFKPRAPKLKESVKANFRNYVIPELLSEEIYKTQYLEAVKQSDWIIPHSSTIQHLFERVETNLTECQHPKPKRFFFTTVRAHNLTYSPLRPRSSLNVETPSVTTTKLLYNTPVVDKITCTGNVLTESVQLDKVGSLNSIVSRWVSGEVVRERTPLEAVIQTELVELSEFSPSVAIDSVQSVTIYPDIVEMPILSRAVLSQTQTETCRDSSLPVSTQRVSTRMMTRSRSLSTDDADQGSQGRSQRKRKWKKNISTDSKQSTCTGSDEQTQNSTSTCGVFSASTPKRIRLVRPTQKISIRSVSEIEGSSTTSAMATQLSTVHIKSDKTESVRKEKTGNLDSNSTVHSVASPGTSEYETVDTRTVVKRDHTYCSSSACTSASSSDEMIKRQIRRRKIAPSIPNRSAPIAVPPTIHDRSAPITVPPTIHDRSAPITVPPAIHDRSAPIAVLPTIHDRSAPIAVLPTIHDRSAPIAVLPTIHDRSDPIIVSPTSWIPGLTGSLKLEKTTKTRTIAIVTSPLNRRFICPSSSTIIPDRPQGVLVLKRPLGLPVPQSSSSTSSVEGPLTSTSSTQQVNLIENVDKGKLNNQMRVAGTRTRRSKSTLAGMIAKTVRPVSSSATIEIDTFDRNGATFMLKDPISLLPSEQRLDKKLTKGYVGKNSPIIESELEVKQHADALLSAEPPKKSEDNSQTPRSDACTTGDIGIQSLRRSNRVRRGSGCSTGSYQSADSDVKIGILDTERAINRKGRRRSSAPRKQTIRSSIDSQEQTSMNKTTDNQEQTTVNKSTDSQKRITVCHSTKSQEKTILPEDLTRRRSGRIGNTSGNSNSSAPSYQSDIPKPVVKPPRKSVDQTSSLTQAGHTQSIKSVDHTQGLPQIDNTSSLTPVDHTSTLTSGDYTSSLPSVGHTSSRTQVGHPQSITPVDHTQGLPQVDNTSSLTPVDHTSTLTSVDYTSSLPSVGHTSSRTQVGHPQSITLVDHTQGLPHVDPTLSLTPVDHTWSLPLVDRTWSPTQVAFTQSIIPADYTQSLPQVDPTSSLTLVDHSWSLPLVDRTSSPTQVGPMQSIIPVDLTRSLPQVDPTSNRSADHTSSLKSVNHTSSLPPVGHTSSLTQFGHTQSTPPVNHTQGLPQVDPASSLTLVDHTSCLPQASHTQSIAQIDHTRGLPDVDPTSSLTPVDYTSSLTSVDYTSSLTSVDHTSSLTPIDHTWSLSPIDHTWSQPPVDHTWSLPLVDRTLSPTQVGPTQIVIPADHTDSLPQVDPTSSLSVDHPSSLTPVDHTQSLPQVDHISGLTSVDHTESITPVYLTHSSEKLISVSDRSDNDTGESTHTELELPKLNTSDMPRSPIATRRRTLKRLTSLTTNNDIHNKLRHNSDTQINSPTTSRELKNRCKTVLSASQSLPGTLNSGSNQSSTETTSPPIPDATQAATTDTEIHRLYAKTTRQRWVSRASSRTQIKLMRKLFDVCLKKGGGLLYFNMIQSDILQSIRVYKPPAELREVSPLLAQSSESTLSSSSLLDSVQSETGVSSGVTLFETTSLTEQTTALQTICPVPHTSVSNSQITEIEWAQTDVTVFTQVQPCGTTTPLAETLTDAVEVQECRIECERPVIGSMTTCARIETLEINECACEKFEIVNVKSVRLDVVSWNYCTAVARILQGYNLCKRLQPVDIQKLNLSQISIMLAQHNEETVYSLQPFSLTDQFCKTVSITNHFKRNTSTLPDNPIPILATEIIENTLNKLNSRMNCQTEEHVPFNFTSAHSIQVETSPVEEGPVTITENVLKGKPVKSTSFEMIKDKLGKACVKGELLKKLQSLKEAGDIKKNKCSNKTINGSFSKIDSGHMEELTEQKDKKKDKKPKKSHHKAKKSHQYQRKKDQKSPTSEINSHRLNDSVVTIHDSPVIKQPKHKRSIPKLNIPTVSRPASNSPSSASSKLDDSADFFAMSLAPKPASPKPASNPRSTSPKILHQVNKHRDRSNPLMFSGHAHNSSHKQTKAISALHQDVKKDAVRCATDGVKRHSPTTTSEQFPIMKKIKGERDSPSGSTIEEFTFCKCEECDFTCLSTNDLEQHKQETHQESEISYEVVYTDIPAEEHIEYKCTVCGANSKELSYIYKHIKTFHDSQLKTCERVTHKLENTGFTLKVESIKIKRRPHLH